MQKNKKIQVTRCRRAEIDDFITFEVDPSVMAEMDPTYLPPPFIISFQHHGKTMDRMMIHPDAAQQIVCTCGELIRIPPLENETLLPSCAGWTWILDSHERKTDCCSIKGEPTCLRSSLSGQLPESVCLGFRSACSEREGREQVLWFMRRQ